MGTIKQIKERYHSVLSEVNTTIQHIVASNSDVLLSLNRDQLLLGRDAKGKTFTPGYTSDPYFKTAKQAKAYKNMKIKLEAKHRNRMRFSNVQLYPNKNSNTPNLIVTGPFQDDMFVNVSSDSYTIGSTYVDASDINEKYNGAVFGLAPRSKAYFYNNWIHPTIIKLIKERLRG